MPVSVGAKGAAKKPAEGRASVGGVRGFPYLGLPKKMGCLRLTYQDETERPNFLGVWKKGDGPEKSTDYHIWGGVLREQKYDPDQFYKWGYQGQFAEKDGETGWNHFELREWDGLTGRWLVPDPYRQYWSPYMGMGNNPISGIDPDGGYSRAGAWWRNIVKGGSGIFRHENDGNKEVWGFKTFDGSEVTTHHFGEDARNNYQDGPMLQQWKPNLLQIWEMSDTWYSNMSYELADGAYVTGKFFTPWADKTHLDGQPLVGDDGAEALANTLPNAIPAAKGLKLSAPQFSKLFKGTLSRLQPKLRGIVNKLSNKFVFGKPASATQKAVEKVAPKPSGSDPERK